MQNKTARSALKKLDSESVEVEIIATHLVAEVDIKVGVTTGPDRVMATEGTAIEATVETMTGVEMMATEGETMVIGEETTTVHGRTIVIDPAAMTGETEVARVLAHHRDEGAPLAMIMPRVILHQSTIHQRSQDLKAGREVRPEDVRAAVLHAAEARLLRESKLVP